MIDFIKPVKAIVIIWANNRVSDGVDFNLDEKKRLAGFQVSFKIKIMGFSSILNVQLERKNKMKVPFPRPSQLLEYGYYMPTALLKCRPFENMIDKGVNYFQ